MSRKREDEPQENLMDRLRALFGFQDPHNKNVLPPKARFSIWYFLIAVLAFSYMQQYFFSGKVETIPYSQFKQYVAQGNLASLSIGPEVISGTLKGASGQKFTTVRVNDLGLVKELDENKINLINCFQQKLYFLILYLKLSHLTLPHALLVLQTYLYL